jgi:hypothetical protein
MRARMDREAVMYRLDRKKLFQEISHYNYDLRNDCFNVYERNENGNLVSYQQKYENKETKYYTWEESEHIRKMQVDPYYKMEYENKLKQIEEEKNQNIIIKTCKKILKLSR